MFFELRPTFKMPVPVTKWWWGSPCRLRPACPAACARVSSRRRPGGHHRGDRRAPAQPGPAGEPAEADRAAAGLGRHREPHRPRQGERPGLSELVTSWFGLRSNSRTTELSLPKCATQWFQCIYRAVQPPPLSSSRAFVPPKRTQTRQQSPPGPSPGAWRLALAAAHLRSVSVGLPTGDTSHSQDLAGCSLRLVAAQHPVLWTPHVPFVSHRLADTGWRPLAGCCAHACTSCVDTCVPFSWARERPSRVLG